jgi:hypothetical protein
VRSANESSGESTASLNELLAEGCEHTDLILDVSVEIDGESAIERTGRTPEDVPIVGVVGRRSGSRMVLALSGIGALPVLVEPGALESLQPVDDHRATASYRRHLAEVLTGRVLEVLS